MTTQGNGKAEHPILFNGEMVRAILEGRKTQTRRVIPLRALNKLAFEDHPSFRLDAISISPYGQPGDRLWVRETFCPIYPQDPDYNGGRPIEYDYAATYEHGDRMGDLIGEKKKWKPSIHMPRDACRLLLDVVSVRMERLQDISEEDARAEGCPWHDGTPDEMKAEARWEFGHLWRSINGSDSWDANPWVWVIEFKPALEGVTA